MSTENISHFEPCAAEIEHPFVMVPRDLIRNAEISPQCRWFIAYLLSHSGKWKISIPYIIKNQKISKNRIYRIINEAIEAGYLKREEFLDNGKKRYKYTVSREAKFKKCLLCPQNQDTEKQDPENEDRIEYQSKDLSNDKSLEREEQRERKAAPPQPPPLSFGSHVKLKQEEYDHLCQENGKHLVDDVIDTLNNKIASGETKTPKSYLAKLRQWIKNQKKWDAEKKAANPEKVSKHHGFQKDTSPIDPKKVFRFS